MIDCDEDVGRVADAARGRGHVDRHDGRAVCRVPWTGGDGRDQPIDHVGQDPSRRAERCGEFVHLARADGRVVGLV